MTAETIFQPRDVLLGLSADGKTRLLKELARHAAEYSGASAADITVALATRERLGSTGMGGGIAIPHAKVRGLGQPFAAFARLGAPCPFDAIDGEDVDIVVALLLPEAAPQEHLNILARIARMLRDKDLVARLRQAEDAETIHALLAAGMAQPSRTAA